MDENNNNVNTMPENLDPTATGAGQAPEPQGENSADAKTFTQADLNRVGNQEKDAGKRSILTALGLTDETQVTEFAELIKKLKADEENKMTPTQKYDKLNGDFSALKASYEEQGAELAMLKQTITLQNAGVPADELDFYQFKISKIAKEQNINFDDAMNQYLKERPVKKTETEKPKPPEGALYGGRTGEQNNSAVTAETFKAMSYTERLKLKTQNPQLYAQLGGK